MDVTRILEQLHQELARIDAAIFSLERLLKGTKRRGRPPAWLVALREGELGGAATRRAKTRTRRRPSPAK